MINQRYVLIKTASAVLTYAERGDIMVQSDTPAEMTLPAPNTGMWYHIANKGNGDVSIIYNSAELVKIERGETVLLLCEGTTSWWFSVGGGNSALALTQLTDVPPTYAGSGKRYLRVNEGEDGIEFTDQIDASSILSKPVAIPNFIGKDGYILAYSEASGQFYLKADEGGGGGTGNTTYQVRTFADIPDSLSVLVEFATIRLLPDVVSYTPLDLMQRQLPVAKETLNGPLFYKSAVALQ